MSVSEYAVNLNVERETCLRRLFVCNNGSNGTALIKWFFFCEAPMCDRRGRNVSRKLLYYSIVYISKLLFCYCFAYISFV